MTLDSLVESISFSHNNLIVIVLLNALVFQRVYRALYRFSVLLVRGLTNDHDRSLQINAVIPHLTNVVTVPDAVNIEIKSMKGHTIFICKQTEACDVWSKDLHNKRCKPHNITLMLVPV